MNHGLPIDIGQGSSSSDKHAILKLHSCIIPSPVDLPAVTLSVGFYGAGELVFRRATNSFRFRNVDLHIIIKPVSAQLTLMIDEDE